MKTKSKSKSKGKVNPEGCLLKEYANRQWNRDKEATLDWFEYQRAKKIYDRAAKKKTAKEPVKETVKESPKTAKTEVKENLGGGGGLVGFQNLMRTKKLKRAAASKLWKAMTNAEKKKWADQ